MHKKIKILFVVKNLSVGGAQIRIVRLANGLSERGFQVRIASLGKENNIREEISDDVAFTYSKYFDALRSVPFLSPLLSSLYSVYEIFRQIRRFNPDVICVMHWAAKIPSSFAGKILRRKTVLVEVNRSEYELKLKGVKGKRHPKFLARKIAYGFASAVVANSKGLADVTSSYFNIPEVATIHNGIDIEAVRRMSSEPAESFWPNENIPLVVTAGRLVEQKGFEFLIEAIKILNDEKIKVRLLILGEGKLRGQMERKIEDYGIADLVRISGFMRNPYSYMVKGDIFACSSLSEGMSNAILEAMALHLPIVSTDHEFGAGEMIEHGVNGLLVPPGDPSAMADALRDLIVDKELGKKLVRQSDEVIRNFTLETMVEKHGDLFQSVAG